MQMNEIRSKLTEWAVGSLMTAILSIAALWFGSDIRSTPEYAYLVLFAALMVILLGLAFQFLSMNASFRDMTGLARPYEGVWVEAFTVEEQDEEKGPDTLRELLSYKAVTQIGPPQSEGKSVMSLNAFRTDGYWRSGYGSGRILGFGREERKAVFDYKGRYYDRKGVVTGNVIGFGFFQFDEMAAGRRPEFGSGFFFERPGDGNKPFNPVADSVLRRVTRRQVRKIVGRSSLRTPDDYQKIALAIDVDPSQ
jgi:hypothetical protein